MKTFFYSWETKKYISIYVGCNFAINIITNIKVHFENSKNVLKTIVRPFVEEMCWIGSEIFWKLKPQQGDG